MKQINFRKYKKLYFFGLYMLSYIQTLRFGFFYLLFRLIPLRKNKIVFCSYYGKGFGDNAKYIALELLNNSKEFDLVWQLSKEYKHNHGIPSSIRKVTYGSVKEIFELCTAKFWIDNSRKKYKIFKRSNQFYIQTWHGSLGVKKVENDVSDSLTPSYIAAAKADSRMANLFVSNGKHIRNLYRNSFWYDGEIIESGCPRNDIFFKRDENVRDKVYESLLIEKHFNIALYAPTFRKKGLGEQYDLSFEEVAKALKNRFKGEWVIVLRLHPNRASEVVVIENKHLVKNATKYDDMQELLAVSSVLITDYSSSIFDYAVQRKPAFLFTPDQEVYASDRSFYFDLETLPFPKAHSNDTLISNICDFNEQSFLEKIDKFYTSNEVFEDGNASKRIAERIILEMRTH